LRDATRIARSPNDERAERRRRSGDFIYVPSINACSMSANVLRRSFEHDKFSSRDALAAGKDLAKH